MIFTKFEKKGGILLSYFYKIGNGLLLRSKHPDSHSKTGSWFSSVSPILLIRLIYSHRSGDLPGIPSIFFAVGAKKRDPGILPREGSGNGNPFLIKKRVSELKDRRNV